MAIMARLTTKTIGRDDPWLVYSFSLRASKPETVRRLEKLGEEFDGGRVDVRKHHANDRPISRTRLIREYQGVEHCVTVRDKDFEYGRHPYKSLSAVARTITGIQRIGLAFIGLKLRRRA